MSKKRRPNPNAERVRERIASGELDLGPYLSDDERLRLAAGDLADSETLQARVLDAVRDVVTPDVGELELRDLLTSSLTLRIAADELRAALKRGDAAAMRTAVGAFALGYLATRASRPIAELDPGDGAIAGIPTTMGDPDYLPHPRA